MNKYTLALILTLTASPLMAQTILSNLDLAEYGYAGYKLHDVQADGDMSTRELLAIPIHLQGWFRVIAISPSGGYCQGDWFVVSRPTESVLHVEVATDGLGIHRIVAHVQNNQLDHDPPVFQRTVRLDRPVCP